MNISCDMAIDLISLYKDGAASEDSKTAIREHLNSCPSCARIYKSYSADMCEKHPRGYAASQTDLSENYAKLARSLRKKHITDTVSVAAVITLSIAACGYCLIKTFLSGTHK